MLTAVFGSTVYFFNELDSQNSVVIDKINDLSAQVDRLSAQDNGLRAQVQNLSTQLHDIKFMQWDLKLRFDATAIGGAFVTAALIGAGSIVDILEYFYKKSG